MYLRFVIPDPFEFNADSRSFSNEDRKENVEDCLNRETTASDVPASVWQIV